MTAAEANWIEANYPSKQWTRTELCWEVALLRRDLAAERARADAAETRCAALAEATAQHVSRTEAQLTLWDCRCAGLLAALGLTMDDLAEIEADNARRESEATRPPRPALVVINGGRINRL